MAALERQKSVKGPGAAQGALNYGLHDRVMRVEVLDKVREAKKDTLDHFAADVLGLKGPQWTSSVTTNKSKYCVATSDQTMGNTLVPSCLNSKDLRILTHRPPSTGRIRSASTSVGGWDGGVSSTYGHGTAAFERGFGTDGWDQSTLRNGKRDIAATEKMSATAAKSPVRREMERRLKDAYVDPVARQTSLTENMRQRKLDQSPTHRLDDLTARYGPEGAQAMLQIEQMPVPTRRVSLRTRPDDLAAVRALPLPPDDEDSTVSMAPSGILGPP